ncbi:MAG: hypothetical protein HYU97_07055 [Deltaproteobacteria bacterium]|nr:hypothetical protein [Deltaproteobacteria bacterium]
MTTPQPSSLDFVEYLHNNVSSLDPNLRVLDQNLPILNIEDPIDLVVSNQQMELFLIKVFSSVTQKDFFTILKLCNWVDKNWLTLAHVYEGKLGYLSKRVEVCCLTNRIHPEVGEVLHELKATPLKIFLYEGVALSDHSGWTIDAYKPSEFEESIERAKLKKKNLLPSKPLLSREEIDAFLSPTSTLEQPNEDFLSEFSDDEVTVNLVGNHLID